MAEIAFLEVLVRPYGSTDPHWPLLVPSNGSRTNGPAVCESLYFSRKISRYTMKAQYVEIYRNAAPWITWKSDKATGRLSYEVWDFSRSSSAPSSSNPPAVVVKQFLRVVIRSGTASIPLQVPFETNTPTVYEIIRAIGIKHEKFEISDPSYFDAYLWRDRRRLEMTELVPNGAVLELQLVRNQKHPSTASNPVKNTSTIQVFLKHDKNAQKYACVEVTGTPPLTVRKLQASLQTDYNFMLKGGIAVFSRAGQLLQDPDEQIHQGDHIVFHDPDPMYIGIKQGKCPPWIESRPAESLRLKKKLQRKSLLDEIQHFKQKLRELIDSFRRYSKCSVFKTEAELLKRQRRELPWLNHPFPVKADDIDSPEMLYGASFFEGEATQSQNLQDVGRPFVPTSAFLEISHPRYAFAPATDASLIDVLKSSNFRGRVFSLVQQSGTGKTKQCMDLALTHGVRLAWISFKKQKYGGEVGNVLVQGFKDIAARIHKLCFSRKASMDESYSVSGTAAEELSRHFIQLMRIAVMCFPQELTPAQVLKLQHIPSVSRLIARFVARTLSYPSEAFKQIICLPEKTFEVPWSHPAVLVVDDASNAVLEHNVPHVFQRYPASSLAEPRNVLQSFIAACASEASNLAFCIALTGTNLQLAIKNSNFSNSVVPILPSKPYATRATLNAAFEHYLAIPFPEGAVPLWNCRWSFVVDFLLRGLFQSRVLHVPTLVATIPNGLHREFERCADRLHDYVNSQALARHFKDFHMSPSCIGWEHLLPVWQLALSGYLHTRKFSTESELALQGLDLGVFLLTYRAETGKYAFVTTEPASLKAVSKLEGKQPSLQLRFLEKGALSNSQIWKDYVLYSLSRTRCHSLVDAFAGPPNIPHPTSVGVFDPTVLFYSFDIEGCVTDGDDFGTSLDALCRNAPSAPSCWVRLPSNSTTPDFMACLKKFDSFEEALAQHEKDSSRYRQLLALRDCFYSAPLMRPILLKCLTGNPSQAELEAAVQSVRFMKSQPGARLQTSSETLEKVYSHSHHPLEEDGDAALKEPPLKRSKADEEMEPMEISASEDSNILFEQPWPDPASHRLSQILREAPSLATWSLGVLAVLSTTQIAEMTVFPPLCQGHCGFAVVDHTMLKESTGSTSAKTVLSAAIPKDGLLRRVSRKRNSIGKVKTKKRSPNSRIREVAIVDENSNRAPEDAMEGVTTLLPEAN